MRKKSDKARRTHRLPAFDSLERRLLMSTTVQGDLDTPVTMPSLPTDSASLNSTASTGLGVSSLADETGHHDPADWSVTLYRIVVSQTSSVHFHFATTAGQEMLDAGFELDAEVKLARDNGDGKWTSSDSTLFDIFLHGPDENGGSSLGPETFDDTLTLQAGTYFVPLIPTFTTGGDEFGADIEATLGVSLTTSATPVSTTGSIAGTVFNDANQDWSQDSGETGLSGATVYLDSNNNGVKDSGERTTTTSGSGGYTFAGVTAGTAHVRVVTPAGYRHVVGPPDHFDLSVTAGVTSSGKNFAMTSHPLISGRLFSDANNNSRLDTGELPLAGWTVYCDLNNNGKLDAGENTKITDSAGNFSFAGLNSGAYVIRQALPANWSQTLPAGGLGEHVTVSAGQQTTGLNFGDHSSVKYLSTVATSSGLVAWWTFDSASKGNSIVNGYTGTLKGGAAITSTGGAPIAGESTSSGLSLNGTSAYVDTNLTTQQQFATAGTYNVWIDLGSTPAASGHYYTIAAKSVFGNDLDLFVETDGKVCFYTDNGTSTSFKPTSLTGWHMVTAEFDTVAKTRRIFWDGQPVASTANYTGTHSANTGTFSIGESDVFTGRFFDGKIDEVSIWSRALTASEILALYNASK